MKGLKRWGFRRLGGKRGFTLIELLIVMVILAILAGVVIVAVGGVLKTAEERAYDSEKETLRTATMAYYTSYGSVWPATTTINITGCTNCKIIDVCRLLYPPDAAMGLIDIVPASSIAINGSANDNCDVAGDDGATCNCTATSHYIWAVDTDDGAIHSTCTGADCTATGTDGYQGVHP